MTVKSSILLTDERYFFANAPVGTGCCLPVSCPGAREN